MLGFSVSLGSKLNQSYIQSMVSQGYDTIFTSLQIPEEDDQLTLIHFGELCQILSQYSITFIIDVNPSLLISLFVIRIDHDLNINLIHDIQQHGYRCCINA
ncbi:MAG: MupG family TIM beta-alpha barrel fold protein, partial [Rickettsia endosymbiont of Ixodes persulcatus]|nr:MupG family TIM beta-alpha barrel fold protein [Rickettsia endosymbiont of Ixodes persulcatus]